MLSKYNFNMFLFVFHTAFCHQDVSAMNRGQRRRILALASGPPGQLQRKNRRHWFSNPRNCPSWWKLKWQLPNHLKNGEGFTAEEERTLLKSLQNFLNRKVYIQSQIIFN